MSWSRPFDDPLAVVNSELRVHGMTGPRVADASVMSETVPEIKEELAGAGGYSPSGHTLKNHLKHWVSSMQSSGVYHLRDACGNTVFGH